MKGKTAQEEQYLKVQFKVDNFLFVVIILKIPFHLNYPQVWCQWSYTALSY